MRKLATAAFFVTLFVCFTDAEAQQCQLAPPALHDPPNNSVAAFGTITLRWDEVPNATAYEPFLSIDGGPPQSLGLTQLNRKIIEVGPGHTVKWAVKAKAPNCAESSSPIFEFTTDCPADRPAIATPARGERFTETDEITFSWSAVPGAESYDVVVTPDFGQTFIELAGDLLTRFYSTKLPRGDWGWYVRANFEGQCPPVVSEPSSFEVGARCDNPAPVLSAPAEGATVSLPFRLEWQPARGATAYNVFVATGRDTRAIGRTTGTSFEVAQGVEETFAWFVSAEFPNNCPSIESERRSLTIKASDGTCGSGQAVPLSPANGATGLASPVTFTWQGVSGATGYRVLAAIGSNEVVTLGTTQSTSLTAPVPAGSGFWLVQTLFGENCPSTFSPRFALTVATGATCSNAPPTLVSPANGAANVGSRVQFRWNAVPNAVKYALFVAAGSNDFAFYGATEGTSLEAFVPPGAVRWLVAASFAGCPETRSAVATFTAGQQNNCPTGIITLRAPQENASVASPVTLSWSPVTGVQVVYRVTIASGGSSITRRTTNTIEAFDLPAGAMSWHVEGLREGCDPIVSAEGRFTVQRAANCDANRAPSLIAPAGTSANPAVVTAPVTLSWNAAANAVGYRVWISRGGNAFEDVTVTDKTQVALPLPAGTYGWYVQALFRGCDALASSTAFFRIGATGPRCTDAAPAPLSPVAGASVAAPVEFRWTAVANAVRYRLFASIGGSEERLIGTTDATTLTRVLPPGAATWRVEAVFQDCPSTSSARVPFTIPQAANCTTQKPELLAPANNATLTESEVDFAWTPVSGAVRYVVVARSEDGSPVPIGDTRETSLTRKVPAGRIEWSVVAFFAGCPPQESNRFRFTVVPNQACANRAPVLLLPREDSRAVPAPVTFAWSRVPNATGYNVWVAQGEREPSIVASTTDNIAEAALPEGTYSWFVEARFANCASTESARGEVKVSAAVACGTPGEPRVHVVAQVHSGTPYRLRWTPLPNVDLYEVQESTSPDFSNAPTFTASEPVLRFVHDATGAPVQYLYRVRGISKCDDSRGTYSNPVSVVVVPQRTNNASAELGVEGTVVQKVVLPGSATPVTFAARVDKPWLTVTPATGTLGSDPVTLTVTADPASLFLGTNTGTVTVTYTSPSADHVAAQGTTTATVPVSVSLVTPVTPSGKGTPPPESLIFPIVGHATGVNDSLFESDIRVANLTPNTMKYQVNFTPSGTDGTVTGSSTTIEIPPNTTTALDDVVATLFGTGTTSSALGMIEVRPLTTSTTPTSLFTSLSSSFPALATAASSRTYNFTPNGTFGQFIPAIPFAKFAGKGSVLSLLQVSQSANYRANFGFAEASGSPVDLLLKVYDTRSNLLAQIPVSLGALQHTQINGMLSANGINDLADGRVDVEVVNGNGKVTAYVSEIDNKTNDPLLVNAVAKGSTSANRYVVPGMAYINSSFAFWVSDLRIFNAGPSTTATLTFYPQGNGTPASKQVTIDAGEIEVLDNVVSNFFGQPNGAGGAIVITTPTNTQLSATARTYNQTAGGTYGQFIPAVTVAESIGNGDRALQILQLESSSRIRSNIGISETTGNPVTVEIAAIQPDSIVTPVVTLTLAANEFTQIPLSGFFDAGANVYNARVTVKVIAGNGRVTAYGSAIDVITQDPTYVQAQ